MKILYILNQFPVFSETFILSEITGLIDLGHEISLLSLSKSKDTLVHGEVKEYNLINKTKYFGFGSDIDRKKYSRFRIVKEFIKAFVKEKILTEKEKLKLLRFCYDKNSWKKISLRKFLECLEVIKLIKKRKIDIIYCHFGNIGKQFVVLGRLLNLPFVTYFHGFDFSELPKQGVDYSRLFKDGTYFLTNSNYSKNKIIKLGCPKNKIEVLGLGIDFKKFRFKTRVVKDKIKLLTVARLVEKKGLEYSIRAVAESIKKHQNITYNIIGDGPLKLKLKKLIDKLKLNDKIFLLGAKTQSRVLNYMLNSHIFVLSSITSKYGGREGLGVALLEAQATGMPVLATLHGGFLESVNSGLSGFLVPEKEVGILSKKLNYLIENQKLREKFGIEGRKHVVQKYNKSKILYALTETFKRLIEQKELSEKTGCLIPEHCRSIEQQLIYLKCLFAYKYAQKNYNKGEVLDVGCGDGYGTYFLSKQVNNIIGLDIQKNLINRCRIKYKRNNLKFILYNGKELPFQNNRFSLVTCFHVIEHIKEDRCFLNELKRVLKKKGILLISTPYRCYRLKRGQTPWNRFHVREYYPSQFIGLLKEVFPNVKLVGITADDLIRKIEYKRVGRYKKLRLDSDRTFSTNDFFIIKQNFRNSLDLLGICKINKKL